MIQDALQKNWKWFFKFDVIAIFNKLNFKFFGEFQKFLYPRIALFTLFPNMSFFLRCVISYPENSSKRQFLEKQLLEMIIAGIIKCLKSNY